MKFKFNLDDDLALNKTLERRNMIKVELFFMKIANTTFKFL